MRFKCLILFCQFLFVVEMYAQHYKSFYSIDMPGISNIPVNALMQDHDGYLWVGTLNGVLKYNGYGFKTYRNNPSDSNSLSNNSIFSNCIIEDKHDNIWIGTNHGLNIINPFSDSVYRHYATKDHLSNNSINRLYKDESGNIWVGTTNGLSLFIDSEQQFIEILKGTLPLRMQNIIRCFCKIENNKMLVGSDKGLFEVDASSYSYQSHFLSNKYPQVANSSIRDIVKDSKGRLWFATYNFGVYYIDEKNILHQPILTNSNEGIYIQATGLLYDKRGNIWISTEQNGVYRINQQLEVANYRYHSWNNFSINSNSVYCIHQAKDGNIWFATQKGISLLPAEDDFSFIQSEQLGNCRGILVIKDKIYTGSDGNGLQIIDLKTGDISYPEYNKSLPSQKVMKIIAGHQGNDFWVATWGGGFSYVIPEKNKIENIKIQSSGNRNDNIRDIITLARDNDQGIWLSAFAYGLFYYSINQKRFFEVINDGNKKSILGNYIVSLVPKDNNEFWILDIDGWLHSFKYKKDDIKGIVKIMISDYSNDSVFSGIKINEIGQTNDSVLWLGTNAGISAFHFRKKSLLHFEVFKDKNYSINAINCDKENNLWFVSENKFCCFKQKTNEIKSLVLPDKLGNGYFSNFFLGADGTMFFGGTNGIIIHAPDSDSIPSRVPGVSITDFKLYKESVQPGKKYNGRIVLERPVALTKEIVLSYRENMITLEFAALDLTLPEANNFAYIMHGFDKNMLHVGNERTATYTNLNPGQYLFQVIASNHRGVWNLEGTSLRIIIKPPFWQTLWFRLILALLIITSVVVIFRVRVYSLQKTKDELEKQVRDRTAEIVSMNSELIKLNATKDKFFSIIAHDLKNPFNVISGFSDLIINNFKTSSEEEKIRFASVIKDSSTSAYNLLENLLQWARSQTSSITVFPSSFYVNALVEDSFQLLRVNADRKKIRLVNAVMEDLVITADRNMLDTVIRNLVSNAIKFSPDDTSIYVDAELKNESVIISIKDQGVGMAPETIRKLFQIDQHISNIGTSGEKGTGLGLIICREFVHKNKGDIWAESIHGAGSTFFIKLPYFRVDDKIEAEARSYSRTPAENNDDSKIWKDLDFLSFPEDICILLVDDNADIRANIREHLKNKFKVLEAQNGKEGLEAAITNIPDLIVCDWIMPEMDGIIFCKMIKNDERTSHIPCIMLTAKNATEDETTGLITGVDDYITKPFHVVNLAIKIRNILESKRKLRDKFALDMGINPKHDFGNEIDNKFLEKVTEFIQTHISDDGLNSELIAREMKMSYSSLYRKIKALTGFSVNIFVRNIRLYKATEMFRQGEKNISQVAFGVGFNDHSYFTRCFTELFEKSPTEFISGLK